MLVSEVLGARLKEVRKGKGLTQDEMASALGCARMSYVHYENAKRTPDVDFLARVSNLTGYSTDFLLGKAECPTPDNEAIYMITAQTQETIESLIYYNDTSKAHDCFHRRADIAMPIRTLFINRFLQSIVTINEIAFALTIPYSKNGSGGYAREAARYLASRAFDKFLEEFVKDNALDHAAGFYTKAELIEMGEWEEGIENEESE